MFHVKGSIVALITPFHKNGSVNFEKLGELIEFHIANHTDAILILGTTGEISTLTSAEADAIVAYTIKKTNKKIPVIVGSGSNCTKAAIIKSKKYEHMGADALLTISPYYNKTNTSGMIRHFTAIADAVSIPLILYNAPDRTGCVIDSEVIRVLSGHPNICGIKESGSNIAYTASISRYLSNDFFMYSGNDDTIIPLLSLGAIGAISVFANLMPAHVHELVMNYLNGNTKKALRTQLYYMDLIQALFSEVNPIPVKKALNLMGMDVGNYRCPLYPMEENHIQRLKSAMEAVGL